jgi:hypothetical protein
MAKKNTGNRLDAARAAHAEATKQLADKQAARNAALIDGMAARDIAKIDNEIAILQQAARTEADRINLLEAEAKREAAAAAIKRQGELVNRFERTLAQADALAVDLQDKVLPDLLAKVRQIISLRERARAAFAVNSSSARAAAGSIEGCAMSAPAVMAMLAYEFYRISARPLLGGRPGERSEPSLPGSLCPRVEWNLTPGKITPFATALKTGSTFAVEKLEQEIGGGAAVGGNGVTAAPAVTDGAEAVETQTGAGNGAATADGDATRTPAQERLSQLLRRQNELAGHAVYDAEIERQYNDVVAQIVAAQAELDAERGIRS